MNNCIDPKNAYNFSINFDCSEFSCPECPIQELCYYFFKILNNDECLTHKSKEWKTINDFRYKNIKKFVCKKLEKICDNCPFIPSCKKAN